MPTSIVSVTQSFQKSRWGLILILVLAAVLRWAFSDSRGLTYDDTFSIILAGRPLGDIIQGTAADTMPPVYYFLLHFWMRLGSAVWFLRSLNILISLATVWMLYRLVHRLAGRPAGLWAALLAAISPLQIYHAQDLRMYAILGFSQIVYVYLFYRIWQSPDPGDRSTILNWIGLVIAGTLAMYSHNLAIIALIIPDLILICQRRWRLLLHLLAAQLGIAVLSLPWLIQVPGQIQKIQKAFWTPRPGLVEVIQAIVLFHSHLPLPAPLMVVAVLFSVQIFTLILFETLRNGKRDRSGWFLLTLVVGLPILLFVISYIMRPVFVTRVFILSSLVYLGLVGRAIADAHVKFVKVFLAAGTIALALIALPFFYSFNQFPRSPFNEAMAVVRKREVTRSIVVHDNKLSYFPSYFYAPDIKQVFLPDPPGSANDTLAAQTQAAMTVFPAHDLEDAVRGETHILFVVFQQTLDEYQEMGVTVHPGVSWLEKHFTFAGVQSVGDLRIFEYKR